MEYLCPACEQPLTKEEFDASGRLFWCSWNCHSYYIEHLGKMFRPDTVAA